MPSPVSPRRQGARGWSWRTSGSRRDPAWIRSCSAPPLSSSSTRPSTPSRGRCRRRSSIEPTSSTAPSREPTQATPARVRAARLVALGADALQIAIAPLFGEGFASQFNDALDLAVAAILIKLLGFHWAFLPTLAAEAMPALDLAPTWTAAGLLVTGSQRWIWWVVAGLTVLAAVALWWFVRWHGS